MDNVYIHTYICIFFSDEMNDEIKMNSQTENIREVLDMPEDRTAIKRNLDSVEKWVYRNFMRFS